MNENNIRQTQFTPKPSSTRLRNELREGKASHEALVGRFQAPSANAEAPQAGSVDQKAERTSRIWKQVAGLGAVAVIGIFGAPKIAETIAPTATGNTYTQSELANMPQAGYTFQPTEGADAAIAAVDPQADLFSGGGGDLTAVRKYIDDQHPGDIAKYEHVEVPVLPADGQ